MLHATDQTADGVATATHNILSVPDAKNTFFTAQDNLTPTASNVSYAVGLVPVNKHTNLTGSESVSPVAGTARTSVGSVPTSKHTNFGASEQVSANASSAKGAHASVPTSKHTNFGASELVSNKASSARSAHSSVPTSKFTRFNSSEDVSNKAASARNAAGSVPTSRTTTFTARLAGAWNTVKNFFNEKGTDYHPGGLAMVNDQKGPQFRELVRYPDGTQFIPHGRNVLLNLPKGAQVLKASRTAGMYPGLPQYADGVGITNEAQFIRDSTRLERVSVPSNVNVPTIDLKPLESLLERINDSIQEGKIIHNQLIMDGQIIAKSTYPYIDNLMSNSTKRSKVMSIGGES